MRPESQRQICHCAVRLQVHTGVQCGPLGFENDSANMQPFSLADSSVVSAHDRCILLSGKELHYCRGLIAANT